MEWWQEALVVIGAVFLAVAAGFGLVELRYWICGRRDFLQMRRRHKERGERVRRMLEELER